MSAATSAHSATLLRSSPDPPGRDRLHRPVPPSANVGSLDAGVSGVRMAWSGDFGRVRVHQPEVVDTVHKTAILFAELGADLDEPTLHLPDTFDTLAVNQDYTLAAAEQLPIRPAC